MSFLKQETGAVTVDWVVLTAGVVGLGLATMAVVSTGVQDVSEDVQDQLESDDIIVSAFTFAATVAGRPSDQVGFMMFTPGSCDQDACEADIYTATEPFTMSNGEVWTRVAVANNAQLTGATETWTNAAGEAVEGPEYDEGYDTNMIDPVDPPD